MDVVTIAKSRRNRRVKGRIYLYKLERSSEVIEHGNVGCMIINEFAAPSTEWVHVTIVITKVATFYKAGKMEMKMKMTAIK